MTSKQILTGLLLVSGLAAIGASVAKIPPIGDGSQDYDIQYFSDAARTDPVGGERYTCSGEHLSWGTRGPYQFTSSMPCP